MSRSKRKTQIRGFSTCESEKTDKKIWHRAFRRSVRQVVTQPDREFMPHFREYSDPWNMGKDGKRYWVNDWKRLNPKYFRK